MTDDLAQRAARHSRVAGWTLCLACHQRWPCDASLFAAALTAEQQLEPARMAQTERYHRLVVKNGQLKRQLADEQVKLTQAVAERDELLIYKRVVEVNGITQYDQTGSAWELIQQLREQLAAEQAARALERAALQTMLQTSEDEAIVSLHDLDGSCNCRMCTELIPMMRAALAGEEGADGR